MKTMKQIITIIVLSALAFSAHAGVFDGTTITYQYYYPSTSSPYLNPSTLSVGTGGAYIADIVNGVGSMNVSGNDLTLNFISNGAFSSASHAFNGFEITDNQANFSTFSTIHNTALSASPALSFDTHHLWVNFANLTFNPGTVQLSVATIPEPSYFAMLLAGLGLIGVISYRHKDKLSDMPKAV